MWCAVPGLSGAARTSRDLRVATSSERVGAMTNTQIQLLDVVALIEDLPEHGLIRGQVGTVVELLGPSVFEVEFSDNSGRTYAMAALRTDQLMALHHQPSEAA